MNLRVAPVCPDGEQGLSPRVSTRGEVSHTIHPGFIPFRIQTHKSRDAGGPQMP